MKNTQIIKYFGVLFLASSLILFLSYQLINHPVLKLLSRTENQDINNVADSFAKKTEMISFISGTPQYYFTAQEIWHYPRKQESYASDVKFISTQKDSINSNHHFKKTPWEIKAEQAWLTADMSRIKMKKNVVIKQTTMTLKTSVLWVWPEKQYAETDQYVTIKSEQGLINATGIKANLINKRYHLLSKVYARFNES